MRTWGCASRTPARQSAPSSCSPRWPAAPAAGISTARSSSKPIPRRPPPSSLQGGTTQTALRRRSWGCGSSSASALHPHGRAHRALRAGRAGLLLHHHPPQAPARRPAPTVEITEPMPAPIPKMHGQFRFQCTIKSQASRIVADICSRKSPTSTTERKSPSPGYRRLFVPVNKEAIYS